MTTNALLNVLAGAGLAAAVALAAWRAGSLNRYGALAALILGTVVFGLGGIGWAVLLLGFFISSSLLSRLFHRRKAKFEEKFSKGGKRDAGQVLANGGIAGAFVLLHLLQPGAIWPWVGFASALAAANADTWATELGVLSRSAPRSIRSGQKVEPGTSGGVSGLGMAAATGGALLIALLAIVCWQGQVAAMPANWPGWLVGITLAGLAGSLVDSLLGATIQAIYWCPACEKETERHPLHICGTQTTLARGWAWLNNDWVNTTCTAAGAALGVVMALAG